MLYSDLTFILGFFPVITLLSLLDRSAEYKNMLLIIGSVLFLSWGRPFYVSSILLFSLADWLIALAIDKKCKNNSMRKILLAVDGILNIIALTICGGEFSKAAIWGFVSLNSLVPLCVAGIFLRGFFYTYEVYKKEVTAEKNYFCLLTYTSSLVMLGSGYLSSYKSCEKLIRNRKINPVAFSRGLTKMFVGMGKIVILSSVWGKISAACNVNCGWTVTLMGIVGFFSQAYFFFTGLWDMSEGFGLTCGFELSENYDRISCQKGVTSIVTGFNVSWIKAFEKISASFGEKFVFLALPIAGGLIGFVYRQTLTFAVTGLLAGFVIALEKTKLENLLKKFPAVLRGIYTFIIVMLIFSLAYFENFSLWGNFITLKNIGTLIFSQNLKNVILNNLWVVILSLFVSIKPLNGFVRRRVQGIEEKSPTAYRLVNGVKTLGVGIVFAVSVVLSL